MSNTRLQNFDNLTTWQRRGERAPHKPLLALWAIGQCLQGRTRLIEYDVIHRALLTLLQTFGPPRKSYKPQEPFWRMQKDHIWEVAQAHRVPEQSNGSVSPSTLRQLNILGGFPSDLYDTFRRDPNLALAMARQLVDAHFPDTMRAAVLEATLGDHAFDEAPSAATTIRNAHSPLLTSALTRRRRNPHFRRQVLGKYNYRCAVCGYSFEFPIGYWPALEAAHIRWHSHHGPDDSENGLSLCVLHHELFDWGIFTIQPDSLHILVTKTLLEQIPESPITNLHETPLQAIPKLASDQPASEHLSWHTRNVFRD